MKYIIVFALILISFSSFSQDNIYKQYDRTAVRTGWQNKDGNLETMGNPKKGNFTIVLYKTLTWVNQIGIYEDLELIRKLIVIEEVNGATAQTFICMGGPDSEKNYSLIIMNSGHIYFTGDYGEVTMYE